MGIPKFVVYEVNRKTKSEYVLKVFNAPPSQAEIDALPTHASSDCQGHCTRIVKRDEYIPVD